jgi:putative hydrolase of the HAD superfamily
LPFATDLLEQLQPYYKLHILTNGFADIQQIKLQASGISQYFTMVVTPEEAGAPKPSPRYFSYVLDSLKAQPKHCLMIGDNINTDISGALSSGIDAVYINSNNKLHTFDLVADVQCLSELLNRF